MNKKINEKIDVGEKAIAEIEVHSLSFGPFFLPFNHPLLWIDFLLVP